MGKFVGQLEVPELKYYRDAYGNQYENYWECQELNTYGRDSSWKLKYKDRFDKHWLFWNWYNEDYDVFSVEYFYYERIAFGKNSEDEINYNEESIANHLKSFEYIPPLPEPIFHKFQGKYKDKCRELWEKWRDVPRILEWINEEFKRLKTEEKKYYDEWITEKDIEKKRNKYANYCSICDAKESLLVEKKYLTELYD